MGPSPIHSSPTPLLPEEGGGATDGVKKVMVIDEVGKMELFSRGFVERVKTLFDKASSHTPNPGGEGVGQGGVVLLATIPVHRPQQKQHWLLETIRRRKDCWLLEVTSHFSYREINLTL